MARILTNAISSLSDSSVVIISMVPRWWKTLSGAYMWPAFLVFNISCGFPLLPALQEDAGASSSMNDGNASNSIDSGSNDSSTVKRCARVTFPATAPTGIPVGGAVSIALSDFNRDLHLDIATANYSGQTASILLGNGDGTFRPKTDYTPGSFPEGIAVGDLNGDGNLDIVTADNGGSGLSAFLGSPNGTFELASQYHTGDSPHMIAIGDLNNDGRTDLVIGDSLLNPNDPTDLTFVIGVLLGNGDGTFSPVTNYPSGTQLTTIAIADLNHDGKPDIVGAGSNSLVVFMGSGNGSFNNHLNNGDIELLYAVSVADLNADGFPDIVAVGLSSGASVLLGRGDGTFSPHVDYPCGMGSSSLAVADFNGDGSLDIAVGNNYEHTVSVLFNDGHGAFHGRVDYPTNQSPNSVAAGDLDNDGVPDLVVAAQGGVDVLLATCMQ